MNYKTKFALIGALIFIAMMVIAEYQVRSSPQWPPPPRHEVGGWEIKPPIIWDAAAGLNLPASVPFFWLIQQSDGLTYAFDDHQLITYIPWILCVVLLWAFVGWHFEYAAQPRSRLRTAITVIQVFVSVELVWSATLLFSHARDRETVIGILSVCAWITVAIAGWWNLTRRDSRKLA